MLESKSLKNWKYSEFKETPVGHTHTHTHTHSEITVALKKQFWGTSRVVQWFKNLLSKAGDVSWIPGQGIKVPYALVGQASKPTSRNYWSRCAETPHSTREAAAVRSPRSAMRGRGSS